MIDALLNLFVMMIIPKNYHQFVYEHRIKLNFYHQKMFVDLTNLDKYNAKFLILYNPKENILVVYA